MKHPALLVFMSLSILGVGCTAPHPIRPVPDNQVRHRTQPPRPAVRKPVPATRTYPIDNRKPSIQVQPNVPVVPIDLMAPPPESSDINSGAGSMQAGRPFTPDVPAYRVEDARLPSGSSPAVIALLTEADRSRAAGDLDAAVVATERALRIDSRNPTLTYRLAQLRIKQNKPRLAEELAGKAALLAGGNVDLKRKSWLLIAEARRMQQNYQGAKEAKARADSFSGRW